MSDVVDFAKCRHARELQRRPAREPDLELQIWIENEEVDWILTQGEFFGGNGLGTCTSALLDAAWIYGANSGTEAPEDPERPAFWWMLRADGQHAFVFSTKLYENTSATHALWFIRQWWRLTLRCARLAWHIWKGR